MIRFLAQFPKMRRHSEGLLSTMVGALTLSRVVNDPDFAQGFLTTAIEHIRETVAT